MHFSGARIANMSEFEFSVHTAGRYLSANACFRRINKDAVFRTHRR